MSRFVRFFSLFLLALTASVGLCAQHGGEVWETEVLNSRAGSVLSKAQKLLQEGHWDDPSAWTDLLAPDFETEVLLPETLNTVGDLPTFSVVRGVRGETAEVVAGDSAEAAWVAALEAPVERFFGEEHHLKVKFKLFKVHLAEDGRSGTTLQYVKFGAHDGTTSREQNSLWEIDWALASLEEAPRIAAVRVLAFEEVSYEGKPGADTVLQDHSERILAGVEAWDSQLKLGTNYWLERMENRFPLYYYGNQGIALGDIDGDGRDDVFVCQPGGLPNRLLRHREDGTVEDVSAASGLDFLDYTRSALFVDLDNDGDQDLALASLDALFFFANDGDGHFTEVATWREARGALSLSAVDFDADGKLDLYVCKYFADESQEGNFALPIPYHDANNGGRNILLRNYGAFVFEDVTEATGMDANNSRFSFAAAWEDYDNDGDLDVYVANDFGRNCLYRHDPEGFVEVAAELGVQDLSAGMSAAWGDVNGDGWMDLYVSNMFSSAGNRIAYQRRFQADLSEDQRAQFQRHARGNSLFLNRGGQSFEDVTESAGAGMGRWAWASQIADLNSDGKEDILVANGYITGRQLDDL